MIAYLAAFWAWFTSGIRFKNEIGPKRVTASWWRCWLMRVAFRSNHGGRISRLCWKLARAFASEDTHAALAAYCSGLIMNGVLNGEM